MYIEMNMPLTFFEVIHFRNKSYLFWTDAASSVSYVKCFICIITIIIIKLNMLITDCAKRNSLYRRVLLIAFKEWLPMHREHH